MTERADVVIYTRGWMTDQAMKDGEEPLAMLHGRVFVNGTEIPRAGKASIVFQGGDFATVEVTISPSAVKVLPLSEDAWDAL